MSSHLTERLTWIMSARFLWHFIHWNYYERLLSVGSRRLQGMRFDTEFQSQTNTLEASYCVTCGFFQALTYLEAPEQYLLLHQPLDLWPYGPSWSSLPRYPPYCPQTPQYLSNTFCDSPQLSHAVKECILSKRRVEFGTV